MEKETLQNKLNEITGLLNSCNKNDISLFTGLSGVNIALCNFNSIKYHTIILSNIEKIILEINKNNFNHTFCSGLSGFAWSLNYLLQKGIIKKNDVLIFDEINSFLYRKMIENIKNKNYDLLYGSIGVGLYFISNFNSNYNKDYIEELIDYIELISIKDNNGLKWESTVFDPNENPILVYNFGLSHGIASIISFLTKAYLKNISIDKTKRILDAAINYLLHNENDLEKDDCFFPSWINDNDGYRKSRLAWCYGDLGISVALYNAAKALENKSLEEYALKVLRYSASKKNLENEFVFDAGLCHGTAGIAHIFNRMYWNTKDEIFKNTASFWFEKTIEMSRFHDGLAGYKTKKNNGWESEFGLLDGITGIGLALNSWITQTEPTWDECLLLS